MANQGLPDDLIGTREAAKVAQTHINTLKRWCFSGKLRFWRRNHLIFVSRADVVAMWREHIAQGTGPKPRKRKSKGAGTPEWARRVLDRAGIK